MKFHFLANLYKSLLTGVCNCKFCLNWKDSESELSISEKNLTMETIILAYAIQAHMKLLNSTA